MLVIKFAAIAGVVTGLTIVAALTAWWDAGVQDSQDRMTAFHGEISDEPLKAGSLKILW